MLTPNEAFRKFRSKLELSQKEQDDASRRQKEIRAHMDESFKIADDFLTGLVSALDQDQAAQGRGHLLRLPRRRAPQVSQ